MRTVNARNNKPLNYIKFKLIMSSCLKSGNKEEDVLPEAVMSWVVKKSFKK